MKPPGILHALQCTPTRFSGVTATPENGIFHHPPVGLGSHPVEVVGRVRQHPDGSDESALQVSDGRKIRVKMDQGTREFSLDGVSLAEKEDLLEFYSKYVEARVDDVKGGGRCTVMMYGPTGAGKSYTMFGSSSEKGIAYLALRNIMDPNTYGPHGCGPVMVRASIIEIYNEEIFDLLATTPNAPGLPKNTIIPRVKLEVMGRKLKGQTWIKGNEHNKLFLEISKTEKRRVIKSTNCNDRSSRSHCVVILEVPAVGGRLVLVDMAGSENIEQAGIGAEARYQTGKINQGNGALKRVVEAIANGHDHIPYRDSKLTMILQASFEDDGARILMILCASPDLRDIYKTVGTLEYGAKAKCILRLPNSPPKEKGASGLESELIAKVQFKDACIQKLRHAQEQKDRAMQEKERVLQEKEEETRQLLLHIEELQRRKSIGTDQQFEMKLKLDQLRRDMERELETKLERELETRLQGELERKLQETRKLSEEEGRRKMEELEQELQRQQLEIDQMRVRAEKAEMELRKLRATPLPDGMLNPALDAMPLVLTMTQNSTEAQPEGRYRGFTVDEEAALQDVSPSSISLVSHVQRLALEGSETGDGGLAGPETPDVMSEDDQASGSPEYERGSSSEHDVSDRDDYDETLSTMPKLVGCTSPAIGLGFRGDMLARLAHRTSNVGEVELESEAVATTSMPNSPDPGTSILSGEKQTSPISRTLFTPKVEKGETEDDLFTWTGASLHTKGWLPIIQEEHEEDEELLDTCKSRTPAADMPGTSDVRAAGNDCFLREPILPSNLNRDKFLSMDGQPPEIFSGSQRSPLEGGKAQECFLESLDKSSQLEVKQERYPYASATSLNTPGCRKESMFETIEGPTLNMSETWRTDSGWKDVSATITDSLRGTLESRSGSVSEEGESNSSGRSPLPRHSALENIVDNLNVTQVKNERVEGDYARGEQPTAQPDLSMEPAGNIIMAEGEEAYAQTPARSFASYMKESDFGHPATRTPEGGLRLVKGEGCQSDGGAEGTDPVTPRERTPCSGDRGEKRSVAANRRARIESIFLLCGERRERKEIASRGGSNEASKSSEDSQGNSAEDELIKTPGGSHDRKRPPSTVESKSSRISQLKASPKSHSPSTLDSHSPALRAGPKLTGPSPGAFSASPAASPLKSSPLKSKKLLSLPGNLFRLPSKAGDHKASPATPGSSRGKSDRLASEQVDGKGGGSKLAPKEQLEEVVYNENDFHPGLDEKCEVFVKWEVAKDSSRKLVHMVSIRKGATLADLRKEIEPHVPEAKQDFTFLFLNGDPSGAPVDRAMEAVLRVASLPDCNNNRSSRLACLRPPAKETPVSNRSIFPFQPLENKMDLDRHAPAGRPVNPGKNGTKLGSEKASNWTGPPVVPQIKGLRTLATGFGIRPGNTLRERANTAHVTEEVSKYLRQ